ncbi:TPA: hypothetical protein ACH3X3_006283 [Trebouxia sp. C0006]
MMDMLCENGCSSQTGFDQNQACRDQNQACRDQIRLVVQQEKPQKECKELAKEHLQGDISLEKDRRIGLLKGWPKNPPHQDQSSTKGMNIESQRFTLFAKVGQ